MAQGLTERDRRLKKYGDKLMWLGILLISVFCYVGQGGWTYWMFIGLLVGGFLLAIGISLQPRWKHWKKVGGE